ncbi:MAG: xylulokinase [Promethearchaeota archaeon]
MQAMTGNLILSLDLGTTGTRAVLFDESNMVGYDYKEWPSFYPSPAEVEQDASTWWQVTKETIIGVMKKTHANPDDILAISVTNQRETIVPVDEAGKPLANAIVWQDRRTAGKECNVIADKMGKDKIYNITGLTIDPYFSASKIMWFKEHKPKVYEAASKFLLVHDFIVKKLTGRFITDHSNASRTMLFDIKNRRWSDEVINALDLDASMLPRAEPSGEVVGNVLPDTGTGLSTKTIVVTGAGDQQCAALGVGVTEEGRVKCTVGTGTFLLAFSPTIKLDPDVRVLCSCGAVKNTYVVEASMFSTGSLLRWARDTIGGLECQEAGGKGISPYALMDELASKSRVGAKGLLFLPFIVGAGAPYWNPDARGTLFGLAAGHGRGDIYRSIMESTSFDVKKNLDVFAEMGLGIKELRITGGGSRSGIWNSILCNSCNIPCIKPEYEESTAVGAALLAATGAGLYPDISKAANDFINIKSRYEPVPDEHEKYMKVMAVYSDLYETLDGNGLFTALQGIGDL